MTQTDLRWTTEKPTQPGWYWYRGETPDDEQGVDDATKPRMARVEFDGLYVWLIGQRRRVDINKFRGEFAGPLTPPEG